MASTGSSGFEPDQAAITKAAVEHSATLREMIQQQYPKLRKLAGALARGEHGAGGLSPTSLVNEAYLRLIRQPQVTAQGTVYFRSCFAEQCRRILVDFARARGAQRRGGGMQRHELVDAVDLGLGTPIDILDLDDALTHYASLNERGADVVVQTVFGGLSVADIAQAQELGQTTVRDELHLALSWLQRRLADPKG